MSNTIEDINSLNSLLPPQRKILPIIGGKIPIITPIDPITIGKPLDPPFNGIIDKPVDPIIPRQPLTIIPSTKEDIDASKNILASLSGLNSNLYQNLAGTATQVDQFKQRDFKLRNVKEIYNDRMVLQSEMPSSMLTKLFGLGALLIGGGIVYNILTDKGVGTNLEEKVKDVSEIKEQIKANAPKQEELKEKLKEKEADLKLENEIIQKKIEQATN